MRVLVSIAGGLGNQIQMTAAARTLHERLGWDIEFIAGGAPVAAQEMRDLLPFPAHRPNWSPREDDLTGADYDGVVALGFGANKQVQAAGWRGIRFLNTLANQAVVYQHHSEVDISMNACRELGVAEEDLIWHGALKYNETYAERFDVVCANGYYRKKGGHWDVKGFPGFSSVANEVQRRHPELSVCCIGATKEEYIHGTVDRTGLSLRDSMALIARAQLVIGTDSMAWHAAGALGVKAIGLFTATSTLKNADPLFHYNGRVVGRLDLECRRMCQEQAHRWLRCERRECQEIGVYAAADAADLRLKGVEGE